MNAIGGRADIGEAASVLGSLREKQINVLKNTAQQTAPAAISGERAIGDASIHDGNRNIAVFRETDEVRPEFGFGDDDEFGAQRRKVWSDAEAKINWEIED